MNRSPSTEDPGAAPARKRRGTCQLCSKELDRSRLNPARGLRPTLYDHIAARHPVVWNEDSQICKECLAHERFEFLMERLALEKGELSAVEAEIALKASQHQTMAADIESRFEASASTGQRIADRVAAIGGSWPFVLGFFLVLLVWIGLNSLLLGSGAFDPYPYILLNLLLSCLAAVQAPIIMMSQNRLAARDRMQANQDFQVNLKAELEVASLHEKVDHLLHSQWQHMVELQEMQIEILNEITSGKR